MTLVGAGYRPELPGVFGEGRIVQCAELVANRYFAEEGVSRVWEIESLAGVPLIIHGLSGNVSSVTGPDPDYLRSIARLADAVRPIIYSDHLAFTAAGNHSLGHLAPNRFDDELLELAAVHIATINEATGRRIRLENLATNVTVTGSSYSPEEYYLGLLEVSEDWDCLLDLTNIWINAQNRPVDAIEFIDAIPAHRVSYVHLAGGRRVHGMLTDTHSEAVHPEVFELLEHLLERVTPEAIIVERDSNWQHADRQVYWDVRRALDIVDASVARRELQTEVGRAPAPPEEPELAHAPEPEPEFERVHVGGRP